MLSQHRETNLPIKGGSPLYRAEGLLPSLGGLIRVLYNETQSSLTWLVSLDALPTIHFVPDSPLFVWPEPPMLNVSTGYSRWKYAWCCLAARTTLRLLTSPPAAASPRSKAAPRPAAPSLSPTAPSRAQPRPAAPSLVRKAIPPFFQSCARGARACAPASRRAAPLARKAIPPFQFNARR